MKQAGRVNIRIIVLIVIGLVLAGAAALFVQQRNTTMNTHALLRASTRDQAIAEVHAVLAEIDGYDRERAYYDGVVNACASQAQGSGGAYARSLLQCVHDRLKADGKEGAVRVRTTLALLDRK